MVNLPIVVRTWFFDLLLTLTPDLFLVKGQVLRMFWIVNAKLKEHYIIGRMV